MYFWRTYSGQEIDLIEEYDGTLYPHQIKWNEKSRSSKTPMWFSLERSEPMRNINRQNYLEFLL
jgi:hypothetical protein